MATRAELAALFMDCKNTRRALPRPEPPPDSYAQQVAGLAQQERGTAELANRVVLVIDIWTLVAAEQIAAVGTLLASGGSVYGLFPVLRSAIEHSCAAVWIVDTEVDAERKCARAALWMLRSQERICAAASHMGGHGGKTHAQQRTQYRKLRKAIAQQFPDNTDLDHGVIAGETMVEPTDVLRHFGQRWGDATQYQGLYEYLCAMTHPSLAALEYIEIDATGMRIDVGDDFLERLARAAVVPFIKSLEHYAAYCGWNTAPLDDLIGRVNKVLGDTII